MTEDWMYQYPSTTVTRKYRGDRLAAKALDGDGNKLLYELLNHMKFNQLGQLKMTRVLYDLKNNLTGVITASSHFGYHKIEIFAPEGLEVSCEITLIDLPDAIPPMLNNGEIADGEVEGIDYIKTYYLMNTDNCPECEDYPDLTVCTTAELAADESLCTPFTSCDDVSEHCQAEIISFESDGNGTYFLWKAYTEWPPTSASGLGVMAMRAFFSPAGYADDVCTSISESITVDCCEKNEDDYKAVHTEDWGDLDIEYTSLAMLCDSIQTLTAVNGCPPFTWTLVSGGGTLVSSEDTWTADYTSPDTNPDCEENPIIQLDDRCENTKQIQLAVNCLIDDQNAYWQTVYVDYSTWSYGGRSGKICRHRVNRYNCQGELVTSCEDHTPSHGLLFLCSASDNCTDIAQGFCSFYGNYNCVSAEENGACDSWPNIGLDCWACFYRYNWDSDQGGDVYWGDSKGSCADCTSGELIDYYGHACDKRTALMKAAGCCPINPETGLPF